MKVLVKIRNKYIYVTFSALAAFLYGSTRFLQCPHQGAKNSTTHTSSEFKTNLSKLLGVSSTTSEEESYRAYDPTAQSKIPRTKQNSVKLPANGSHNIEMISLHV